jgi:hypothetical protein
MTSLSTAHAQLKVMWIRNQAQEDLIRNCVLGFGWELRVSRRLPPQHGPLPREESAKNQVRVSWQLTA